MDTKGQIAFGDRIAQRREELGLSQSEVARRVPMPLSTLKRWELRKEPPTGKEDRIARLEEVLSGQTSGGIGMKFNEPRFSLRDIDTTPRVLKGVRRPSQASALSEVRRGRDLLAVAVKELLDPDLDLGELRSLIETAHTATVNAERLIRADQPEEAKKS